MGPRSLLHVIYRLQPIDVVLILYSYHEPVIPWYSEIVAHVYGVKSAI